MDEMLDSDFFNNKINEMANGIAESGHRVYAVMRAFGELYEIQGVADARDTYVVLNLKRQQPSEPYKIFAIGYESIEYVYVTGEAEAAHEEFTFDRSRLN